MFFSISDCLITKSFYNSESSRKKLRTLRPDLAGCSILLVVLSGGLGASCFIDLYLVPEDITRSLKP